MKVILMADDKYYTGTIGCDLELGTIWLSFNAQTSTSELDKTYEEEEEAIADGLFELEMETASEIYMPEQFGDIATVKRYDLDIAAYSLEELVAILNDESLLADIVLKLNKSTDTYTKENHETVKYTYYKPYLPKPVLEDLNSHWYKAYLWESYLLLTLMEKKPKGVLKSKRIHQVTGMDGHSTLRFTVPSALAMSGQPFYLRTAGRKMHIIASTKAWKTKRKVGIT